ncbi:MAG: PAS domain-containing protein [Pseudomonadota bacterium]
MSSSCKAQAQPPSALKRLDLATVMKVSQAIAGEVELHRLFDILLRLSLEHACAERAMLVLPIGARMQVQAVAALNADGIQVELADAARHISDLPTTLLQYVADRRQLVLLDDAMATHAFSADETLRRRRLRSVLCLPLLKQARLVGLLYLENTHALTPDRMALLELLASQAASALENAKLYEALNRKNHERRAAVAESQRINDALQESEGRFRRMAETTADVIWITDLEPERVVYASPSFERIWGYSVQDLYRDPRLWTASIDEADRQRIHDAFGRWIGGQSPGPWEAEYRIRQPGGDLRWIHERGSVIADAEGRPRKVSGISTDITARRQAEAALRASEERFALAVAGSNDGIWDLDLVTGQMFMSEQAQRLHGLEIGPVERTRAEWNAAMKFHPDDAQRRSDMFEAYLAGQVPGYDGEWRVRLPDGQDRWVRIRGLCVRDANGRATRAAGSVIDIDAQKRIEVALRKSEQRYALAMQASQDGNFDWDVVTDEYYVSPRAVEIYGLGPDFQYRGREDCLRRVPFATEAARAEWVRVATAHFASRETRLDTDVQVLRQGELRWVHITGLLVRDGEGQPLRWTGSLSDVTERKLSEEALRKSEERFALAVAGSNDGIWDWDTPSGRMFMSERAQRIYGLESGSTMRLRDEWLALIRLHPEDMAAQREAIQSYLDGSAPHYDGEWRVRHADGSYRWVRVRGLCVRDDRGTPLRLAGSVSDIDAHKRAQASLQQAQRLEAVGTLASGIAHDFNNILGAILGFGEVSLRNTRAGSRMRRDLECIMTAGERGRALVERVLAFSRSGSGERVAVHVEGVVHEALTLLSATLPAGVQLRTHLAAGAAAMLGDATQVHQVVVNLATNAVQAMPDGGLLRVALQATTLAEPRLATTGTLPAGDYLLLTVSDTGSGIADDVRERIFDPFVTTKKVGAGSGLGLSLVHGIVTEVGGAVDVATAAGEGSTFTVYLPRTGEAADRGNDQRPVVPRGRHQQVLVVDDEELLVRLATETLIELGYVAVGFTSSTEALAAFAAHPERFDAVLSDERMPDMPGTMLIQALRALRPSIPVLLMTGFVGAEVNARARAAGVKAILGKPVSRRDLAAAMALALQDAPPMAAPNRRLRPPRQATRRA